MYENSQNEIHAWIISDILSGQAIKELLSYSYMRLSGEK